METNRNKYRLTIRFNPEIEKHIFAMKELENVGRKKANLISNAIYHYKNIYSEYKEEILEEVSKEIEEIEELKEVSENCKETGNILNALIMFEDM